MNLLTITPVIKEFLAIGMIFSGLEILTSVDNFSYKRKGLLNDILLFILNNYIITIVIGFVIAIIFNFKEFLVLFDMGKLFQNKYHFIYISLAILLHQLFLYWWHRLSHYNTFLWKIHSIHHTITKMDWLTTYRSHPLDIILRLFVGCIPFLIFGFALKDFLFVLLLEKICEIYSHSNSKINFNFLSKAIDSPGFTRWHHATEYSNGQTKNFGSILPIWDIVFKTYFNASYYPENIGLKSNAPAYNFINQLVYPLESNLYGYKVFAKKAKYD
jgi:sterol desaturase/sphingolipid hydroxylase (fatty acid hydroxylase superfamily)